MFNFDVEQAARFCQAKYLEAASYLRQASLSVQQQVDHLCPAFFDLDFIGDLCEEEHHTCSERIARVESLAYGDTGALLSTAGTSLSGIVLNQLGDRAQQQLFFDYVQQHRCRTFLAVTELDKGSDAGNMAARLDQQGYLTAHKYFVGHGRSGEMGTLMTRTGSGVLDFTMVLLTPALLQQPQVRRTSMQTVSMQGADLSEVHVDRLYIPPENRLGQHLKATEKGMLGLIKTFNNMRPSVAALAIGHAFALVDALVGLALSLDEAEQRTLRRLQHQLQHVRRLNYAAAKQVEVDATNSYAPSLSKLSAVQVMAAVQQFIFEVTPTAVLLDNPWLLKALTDGYAYEWMEGTSHIQRCNVFNGCYQHALRSAQAGS